MQYLKIKQLAWSIQRPSFKIITEGLVVNYETLNSLNYAV